MAKIRTHYDNLKVARDAPIEVIRAAYKSLCMKYHPDLNGDEQRNVRIMAILNTAYEVLADSERRRQHDEWIIEQETESEPRNSTDGAESRNRQEPRYERSDPTPPKAETSQGASTAPANPPPTRAGGTDFAHIIQVLLIPVTVFILFSLLDSRPSPTPASRRESVSREIATPASIPSVPVESSTTSSKGGLPTVQSVEPEKRAIANPTTASKPPPGFLLDEDIPKRAIANPQTASKSTLTTATLLKRSPAGSRGLPYKRKPLDPNGRPWPPSSNYLSETTLGNNSGRAHVTIDNSRNDSDVFLKLVWHESGGNVAVRLIFIKAGDQFKIQNIDAGTYDVRYQDLDSGALNRSRTFALEEVQEAGSVRFSAVTLTLYKVRGGNAPMQEISEDEFLLPEIQ